VARDAIVAHATVSSVIARQSPTTTPDRPRPSPGWRRRGGLPGRTRSVLRPGPAPQGAGAPGSGSSSRCLSRCMLARISLPARGRTRRATSTLPTPCPRNSISIVTRDRRFVWSTRVDGDVHGRPDGPVDATNTPRAGRIDVAHLRRHGALGEADATGGQTAVPHRGGTSVLHVPVDAAGLPLDEPAGVGDVVEHNRRRPVHLEAGRDRHRQLASPRSPAYRPRYRGQPCGPLVASRRFRQPSP
jgi:hypothetical protein